MVEVSICLIISIGFLVPTLTQGITFGDQNIVVSDSMDQEDIDIVTTGTGDLSKVYLVFEDENNAVGKPEVRFISSLDSGKTFSPAISFLDDPDGDDRQIDPSIAVFHDTQGSVLVASYIDNSPGANSLEYYLVSRTSFDGGVSWSDPVLITDDSMAGYPNAKMKDTEVCFDPDGNIFVVWSEDRHIRISYSIDNGSSWSLPQVVREHLNPAQPDYVQRNPTIASDSDHVVVAYDADDYDWKESIYVTRAGTSTLSGALSFSSEVLIPKKVFPMDKTYHPSLAYSSGVFSLAWWDFTTDPNGVNNEDPLIDTPSIAYTRSTDSGATWAVGLERKAFINSSSPTTWHSRPEVSSGEDGTIAVSYLDRSSGTIEVYSQVSEDEGLTWSEKVRANEYDPAEQRSPPAISIDDSNNIHLAWVSRDSTMTDLELYHSKTIIDQPPKPLTGFQLMIADEFEALIGWDINIESDFKQYDLHLGDSEGFEISSETLQASISDQGVNSYDLKDLKPDTAYFARIKLVDQNDLSILSDELGFRTLPINQPPFFTKEIPEIYIDEDSSLENAMNLSYWIDQGWISDDGYGGNTALNFNVIPLSDNPNVTAVLRERSIEQPYWIMDIFPSKPNWAGIEYFMIDVWDMGKDGGFGSPDDRHFISDPFRIVVNSTNDIPSWSTFQDLTYDTQIVIDPGASILKLKRSDTGCLEDQIYRFAIIGNDIDGDFITYSTDDERIKVEPDLKDPTRRSIFTFTPGNQDTPEMDILITADDERGGIRNITIILPVENVNDPPLYVSIDGAELQSMPPSHEISVMEDRSASFIVEAIDIDPFDQLTLTTKFERVHIKSINGSTWNVTFDAEEGDYFDSPILFTLDLYDRARDHVPLNVKINILDRQNPPEWIPGVLPIDIVFSYDLIDPNEKKDLNKFGGPKIRAEWNEEVIFTGRASDIDGDQLEYSWIITDLNGTVISEYSGRDIKHTFTPSMSALSMENNEKFRITLNVTDGNFPGIEFVKEEFVYPDIDNDNDGMIDSLERKYFPIIGLAADPDDDPDGDGIPNGIEIGVDTPQTTDPTFDPNKGGDDPLPENNTKDNSIQSWIIYTGGSLMVIVVLVIIGFLVIVRISSRKEKLEDEDIERRVSEMEKRQEVIKGLYGDQETGDYFGPDQTTLDDLKLDLGGQLYHAEGSGSLNSEKKGNIQDQDHSGPVRESTQGPVFEKGAPGIEFGHSLQIEDDHTSGSEIDREGLERSMKELMD